MNVDTKTIIYRSLIYFAGVCVLFPIYLGFTMGFGHILQTIQTVLYVSPGIIPTPAMLIFLILPIAFLNAWHVHESAKAFFYAAFVAFLGYVLLVKSWILPIPLALFIFCFCLGFGVEYVFKTRMKYMPSYALAAAYLVVGPVAYWLFVAHV